MSTTDPNVTPSVLPARSVVAALRVEHDELAATPLTDQQLEAPSCADGWTIAQVFSHLGSGAEIMLAGLHGGLGLSAAPAAEFNQQVWDRWNAMTPRAQADEFVAHDKQLIDALDALDDELLATASFAIGAVPFPFSAYGFAGLRLNEVALHSWDVRAALDPAAEVLPGSAQALIDLFAGELGFLLGFVGKADRLTEPVVLDVEPDLRLAVDDRIVLSDSPAPSTATFAGGRAALVRLFGGRLDAGHIPGDVTVTGNVGIDDLRHAFPGF